MFPCVSQVTSVGRLNTPRTRVRRAFEVFTLFDEALQPVERFFLAAEHHRDAGIGPELDDHVRAFVGHPHVVAPCRRERCARSRRIVVRAPLLDEPQVLVELEQHRRRAALHRRRLARAAEDEEVSLRVLRHADGFADGLTRHVEPEHFLGEPQLRRVLLELLLLRTLFGGAGQAATAAGRRTGRSRRRRRAFLVGALSGRRRRLLGAGRHAGRQRHCDDYAHVHQSFSSRPS